MRCYDVLVDGVPMDAVSLKQVKSLQAQGHDVVVIDAYTVSECDYNSIENKHSLS